MLSCAIDASSSPSKAFINVAPRMGNRLRRRTQKIVATSSATAFERHQAPVLAQPAGEIDVGEAHQREPPAPNRRAGVKDVASHHVLAQRGVDRSDVEAGRESPPPQRRACGEGEAEARGDRRPANAGSWARGYGGEALGHPVGGAAAIDVEAIMGDVVAVRDRQELRLAFRLGREALRVLRRGRAGRARRRRRTAGR